MASGIIAWHERGRRLLDKLCSLVWAGGRARGVQRVGLQAGSRPCSSAIFVLPTRGDLSADPSE